MATPLQVSSSTDSITGATRGDTTGGKMVADEVPFHDFCGLLEKVQSISGNDRKKSQLSKFIQKWREAHDKLHPSDTTTTSGDTFYPAMRLLLPHLDRQRPAYGLKEVALAKQYIDILNIAKESSDAQKLLNYRAPHASKQDATDFAGVAYFVLRNRCPEKGSLTVASVNQYLDQLAHSNVTKDRKGVKKALQMLLRNTSAGEQKWLIRIIMKELKIGLSENSILAVFHPDALDLFSVSSSLEKVCIDLHNPSVKLNETAISYFTPFRPMLGQRASIDQVVRLMEHQPFYIENKFDGERLQLHKQNDQYRYYSRSSREYTSTFGATPKEGSFTPKIHRAFNSKVHSCILDGEILGWDAETETYLPKGENVDVKALAPVSEREGSNGIQPCFVAFDALMINDTNLANCPLRERVEHLNKVFEPIPGCLHLVERLEKTTKEDVINSLNEAIDRREEGLVIKHPGSFYRPDKRKGSGWLKIKPDYVDSLSDELDLLIIGGYFGVGRRSGMISHFMCAVAVPSSIPGDRPSIFHSFCKVGSGYSMNELRELGHKLKPHWKRFDTKHPPESILLAPGFKEKPDLWLEPQHSVIVQIRAAEIIVSDKYKCGCTLRFPRLEKVRDDKEWYDCMTVNELEDLKRIASGHLAHRHYDEEGEEEEEQPKTKRRKVGARVGRPRGVAEQFRQTDVSSVQEVSSMFNGKEFCVINGSLEYSKQVIERKIAEHGGTFVQNPTDSTYCVLVNKVVVKANNIISIRVHDVVRTQWFINCIEAGKLLPFQPSLMLNTSHETAMKFAELYDKFGDSFIEDTSESLLHEVFEKITDNKGCSREEIAQMETKYFPDDSTYGLFRQYKFYFDKYGLINCLSTALDSTPLELFELEVRLYGGNISQVFDETITHVVVDRSDLKRLNDLRKLQHSHKKKSHFVSSQWITDSIQDGYCKNERTYEPPIV